MYFEENLNSKEKLCSTDVRWVFPATTMLVSLSQKMYKSLLGQINHFIFFTLKQRLSQHILYP